MKIIIPSFIILFAGLLSHQVLAQTSMASKEELNDILGQLELVDNYSNEKLQKESDKIFGELRYSKASKLLKKMLKNNEFTLETAEEMAHSHRLNNETEEAEFWYAQIVGKTDKDITYYYYAKMLLANGKCSDAVTWFKEYKKRERTNRNLGFFESCEEMEEFYEQEYPIAISHPKSMNSRDLDFFAFPTSNNEVIFTSNRKKRSFFSAIDEWTGEDFNTIFTTTYDEEKGKYLSPKALKGDFKSDKHSGTPAFLDDENMIFTMNNEDDRTRRGNKPLYLFHGVKNDKDKWEDFTPIESLNEKQYSSCHPALTIDKQIIYFASNRPGGFGGMDLYASTKVNNEWTKPINLGPGVNTAGNEFFPYIHPNGTLFFSSDGHKGFGGYDLFAVRKVEDDLETFWSNRVNLGKPYNTLHDELGFTISDDMDYGFFTSNRKGGKGEDDIYKWESQKPINIFERFVDKIFVIKDQNGNLIKNSRVIIELKENDMPDSKKLEDDTNENGEISIKVKPFSDYRVTILKDGLEPIVFDVKPLDEYSGVPEVIEVEAVETITPFRFKLLSETESIDNSNITLKSLRTEELIETNATNEFYASVININEKYELMYIDKNKTKHTFNILGSHSMRPEGQIYEYKVIPKESEVLATASPKRRNNDNLTPNNKEVIEASKSSYKNSTAVPVAVSEVSRNSYSVLNEEINIFYDFDKYVLKNEFINQIDRIIPILANDRSLKIEVTSNTDSRGSSSYNKILAKRRSNAIVKYLERKGIRKDRVVIKNMGEENQPYNCSTNCDATAHQQNRRSTIRVVR